MLSDNIIIKLYEWLCIDLILAWLWVRIFGKTNHNVSWITINTTSNIWSCFWEHKSCVQRRLRAVAEGVKGNHYWSRRTLEFSSFSKEPMLGEPNPLFSIVSFNLYEKHVQLDVYNLFILWISRFWKISRNRLVG